MLRFNRLSRLAVCLLLIVCMLLPQAFSAVALEIETEPEEHPGRTVSYVRLIPYYGGMVLGSLEDGTKLTVLGTVGDFYKLDCYGMTAYIAISQVRQNEAGDYEVACRQDSSETNVLPSHDPQSALDIRGALRTEALKYQGVRYVHGGTSPYGFDCSGLTQYVFAKSGYSLYRTVAGQLMNGVLIAKEDLQCGDLIIFQNTTGYGHLASHVGMYIGNGELIHAGDSGVGITPLDHPYITQHYMCSVRVVLSDLAEESLSPGPNLSQNFNGSYWRENSQTDSSGNSFLHPCISAVFPV